MSQNDYPQYEDRIVVFLDILGWKDLIEQTENDSRIVESLVNKMDEAPHLQTLINETEKRGKSIPFGIQVAHFSDTIVLSYLYDPDDPSRIDLVFRGAIERSTSFLQPDLQLRDSSLLQSGLLCRGAIVRGKLFHRGNILFGPALVAAYEMEQNLAIYPRILVSEELVTAHMNLPEREASVRRDSDGLFYLDTFSYFLRGLDSGGNGAEYARICFRKFQESIVNGLRLNAGDPKKLMKWTWLANRFNEVIKGRDNIRSQTI